MYSFEMPRKGSPTGNHAEKAAKTPTSTNSRGGPEIAGVAAEAAINLKDPDLYLNRELSLLAFQRRVLQIVNTAPGLEMGSLGGQAKGAEVDFVFADRKRRLPTPSDRTIPGELCFRPANRERT